MNSLNEVKKRIQELYSGRRAVRISISMSRPRLTHTCTARIVGVYPNIFRVAEDGERDTVFHTVRYTDVLTGQVSIAELD